MTEQTVIEALMYVLRDGLGVLAEERARERLLRCDRPAFRQVLRRLRKGNGYDAKWSEADIATLTLEWKTMRGQDEGRR